MCCKRATYNYVYDAFNQHGQTAFRHMWLLHMEIAYDVALENELAVIDLNEIH